MQNAVDAVISHIRDVVAGTESRFDVVTFLILVKQEIEDQLANASTDASQGTATETQE